MIFVYTAIDNNNTQREGKVEASSIDSAITVVQKRGYTIISIEPVTARVARARAAILVLIDMSDTSCLGAAPLWSACPLDGATLEAVRFAQGGPRRMGKR